MAPCTAASALLFICCDCNFRGLSAKGLKRHCDLTEHSNTCPMCGFVESTKRFERHLQLCSLDLNCHTCGGIYASKDMLEHLEGHAITNGAFRCPYGCDEVYTSKKMYLATRSDHCCHGTEGPVNGGVADAAEDDEATAAIEAVAPSVPVVVVAAPVDDTTSG